MVNTNLVVQDSSQSHNVACFLWPLKAFDLGFFFFFSAAVIPSSEMPNKLNGLFHVIVQSSLFLDNEISKNNTDSSSKEVKENKNKEK